LPVVEAVVELAQALRAAAARAREVSERLRDFLYQPV